MAALVCLVPFRFWWGLVWTQVCAGFMSRLFGAELACRDRANEWEMHELYVAYSHLSLSGKELALCAWKELN